ncbi:MAG: PSD1 domain-containing protein [Bryobacterales bacterium]|nr:PSD1 domain-containing protein [Bryobacterales bacterium]
MRWILSSFFVLLPALAADAPALLTQKCAKCHGAGALLSDLDVTTRAGLLKGGKHGPAIVPGDSAKSRLYQLVSEGKMPPGGRLDAAELAAIRSWIDAGATMADSSASKAKRSWWAFETPRKTPGFETIDAFLLAKLKEKGLTYNPKADHRTLIRRLYFDLTGLPPNPEDYNQSYEAAVDKLLASPQYGERWGRHWLDVVRFGETDGGEHNFERFNAWPYRDWVIQSINADKPYTDFIREQLAGDILFPQDPKKVAATGFLVAGPWDSVSAVLNKDEALREQARYDELDDMVTTTAHSFLAMTVNCARCHDHKFDPIPTRDYYRMTAFFNAVGFGEREVGTDEARAAREAYLKPLRKQMDGIKARLGDIDDPVRARLLLAKMKAFDQQRAAEPRRIPVNPVFNRNAFQAITAKQFRFVVTGNNGKAAPKLAYVELLPAGKRIDNWTGTAAASADQRQVLTIDLDTPAAVSEIRFASDPVRGSATGSVTVYRLEADGKEVASSMDHVNRNEVDVPSVADEEVVAQLSADIRSKRDAVLAEIRAVQQQMNQAPSVSVLYAAKPRDPEKSYLLERGNVRRKTEELTPGILSAVGGDLPATATSAERRLALANWIADKRNPLTARVMVNRIWQGHFGTGIVGTPSDFGINGDRPSHPELLDHLAIGFMENGWSMKWLHRQIVMTDAYRQTSAMNAKAHAVDAGNRLLWHMPMKRMDAEMLRDSMLAVTGNLSLQGGGPSYLLQKKGGGGSYIYAALNNDGPEVWRRAVYRFVVRGGERIMMDSFDCPDPSVATPQRAVSNTPVQALTMMNHEFVIKQAGLLAKRLESGAATGDARVQRAYALLFGREATASEVARANRFLSKQSLTALCRALFNSNEFLYVP